MAAIPYAVVAALYVSAGSHIYNMSTGGSVEVKFANGKLTGEEQKKVASLEKIAIAPGNAKSVKFAEAFDKAGINVITPYKIQKSFPSSAIQNTSAMTEKEIVCEASKLCHSLGADAILLYSDNVPVAERRGLVKGYLGTKTAIKIDFQALMVSAQSEEILWQQKGKLVLKGVEKMTNFEEADQIVATAIVEKFLKDIGRQYPTGSYAPLPKMPKYNTAKGRECARRCQQEHTLATNACQGIVGGSSSTSQREQCFAEANQKSEGCYGLCLDDETDFKGSTQSRITFDQVLTFVQSSIIATNKKSIEEITKHWADDVIIRLEVPDKKGKQVYNFNKAQYESYLKEAFKIVHDYKVEFKDIKIDISSDGRTAKVTGKLVEKMTVNSRPIKSISGATDTIEMRSGRLVYTSMNAIVIEIE